jgi:hypothetical protein
MANGLAPIPNQPISDTHEWREWFFNLWQSLGGAQGQILYTDLNFTGSNLNSIQTRAHNILQGLQGGNVGGTEYYHLNATTYANVLALPTFGTIVTQNLGLTATITTAKLTPAGANGSMTFVNGLLTAQTQAT